MKIMRARGATVAKVAETFGVSLASVYRHTKWAVCKIDYRRTK